MEDNVEITEPDDKIIFLILNQLAESLAGIGYIKYKIVTDGDDKRWETLLDEMTDFVPDQEDWPDAQQKAEAIAYLSEAITLIKTKLMPSLEREAAKQAEEGANHVPRRRSYFPW